jgi:heptosyltransferase I
MVNELRRGFPDAMIVWAMESPSHKLLGNHTSVDEVLLVPRGWMKSPGEIHAMHRKLRQYRFDIAVDPQSIFKSAVLSRLSGAKTRLGFVGDHGREMSPWLNNCRVNPRATHLVDRSLELIQPIVSDARFRNFGLQVPEDANRFASMFQKQQLAEKPFVAINPGASWPSKRWGIDRFAELARALAADPGITSVITWAGKEENEMAETIVELSRGAAVMAPATSLPELAALYQASEAFVGCDTGPLHIAAAVGTTCVGLYGPTRPVDSGAYGSQHVAIQVRYHSGGCRERRQATNDAMREITTSMVVESVRNLLASRSNDCRTASQAA